MVLIRIKGSGDNLAEVNASKQLEVSVENFPSSYTAKCRDGAGVAFITKDSDGADINNSQTGCQIVINLNYVWDSANNKWVPMTQPT